MDIRSNEARVIERAFIDGHMLARQIVPQYASEDAQPGGVLINTCTSQVFGYTTRDRIYRLDARIDQINLLAADGRSFNPIAFLPEGEDISTTRALSREALLPPRSAFGRLSDTFLTPVSITIACTVVSVAVGHGVHFIAPSLLGYAVNHWPFHRAPEGAAPQGQTPPHAASASILQRLHPRPQYMAFHGEYAEDNAEQTDRAYSDMGANEMDGGVGWSYAEAGQELAVQMPEMTPLNIGIVGGVGLGVTYGIYRAHRDEGLSSTTARVAGEGSNSR